MMNKLTDYIYILATIVLTVYGQVILKWRIQAFGVLPTEWRNKLLFLLSLLFDPLIFSGFAAAFLAGLAWMAAVSRFDLSHAYPFLSLNFGLVLLLSALLLGESVTWQKIAGVVLIALGTAVASQG